MRVYNSDSHKTIEVELKPQDVLFVKELFQLNYPFAILDQPKADLFITGGQYVSKLVFIMRRAKNLRYLFRIHLEAGQRRDQAARDAVKAEHESIRNLDNFNALKRSHLVPDDGVLVVRLWLTDLKRTTFTLCLRGCDFMPGQQRGEEFVFGSRAMKVDTAKPVLDCTSDDLKEHHKLLIPWVKNAQGLQRQYYCNEMIRKLSKMGYANEELGEAVSSINGQDREYRSAMQFLQSVHAALEQDPQIKFWCKEHLHDRGPEREPEQIKHWLTVPRKHYVSCIDNNVISARHMKLYLNFIRQLSYLKLEQVEPPQGDEYRTFPGECAWQISVREGCTLPQIDLNNFTLRGHNWIKILHGERIAGIVDKLCELGYLSAPQAKDWSKRMLQQRVDE